MMLTYKVDRLRILVLSVALAGLGPAVGCSSGDASGSAFHPPAGTDKRPVSPPATDGYRVVEVVGGATLRGTIRYSGSPPGRTPLTVDHDHEACAQHEVFSEGLVVSADGGVANAVVWVEGVQEGKAWPEEVVLDQAGCLYRPHVTVAGTGQPIKFANSDPVIHNVNTFPRENPPLNISLLARGTGRPVTRTFKLPDEIKVTCDAHKWMNAWIIVRDNPYFAVTGADGSYAIEGVPAGTYTVVAWHESLERVEESLQLEAGEVRVEDLELKKR